LSLVCCDNSTANPLTIHVLAAVAEAETKAISQRTKDALRAYRDCGGRLFGAHHPVFKAMDPEKRRKAQEAASAANQKKAAAAYVDLLPLMRKWRAFGLSLLGRARRLNSMGQTTRTGKPWNPVQVKRVLGRS